MAMDIEVDRGCENNVQYIFSLINWAEVTGWLEKSQFCFKKG